ncbi:MAG: hypothetical protein IKU91_01880 [Anaerotignum sp.]|nr:hypothetical protein [Anaerotignum sp.]
MKEEKGELKRMLWDWGRTLERFSWKEEELRKLENFYVMRKKIWGKNESRKDFEKNEKQYEQEVKRLRLEMEDILQRKAQIDGWMQVLTEEERRFLELRLEKGYGFDYIGMKMYRSRATLFRIQEQALNKLILQKERNETL